GKVTLEPVLLDAGHVVSDLVLSMAPLAETKQVSLGCESPGPGLMVWADQKRLQQILSNLLTNAIKFTEAGGRVVVRISAEPGLVVFEISDSGCGISPEFLPHVFDRFRQEDASSTRRRGGIGLGLAIARSLTVLHGGAISVRSDGLDCGATFRVALPAPGDSADPESGSARNAVVS
ncbi:MAG: ATP-binding protein, partial [Herminiimonas sp.]|nr:ATP-binding protein [Herminiimonas sp.]